MTRAAAWTVFFASTAFGALSCRQRPPEPEYKEIFQVPDSTIVVNQQDIGQIVATDAKGGEVLWRYRRHIRADPPYAVWDKPTLVCPIGWQPSRRLVLRYGDELHVIGADDGVLVWKKKWEGRFFCPVAAPDSSVVSVTRFGRAVEKLNDVGRLLWVHDFSRVGVAVTSPLVVLPSGDILVRTRSHLISINPAGDLNWETPHSLEPVSP